MRLLTFTSAWSFKLPFQYKISLQRHLRISPFPTLRHPTFRAQPGLQTRLSHEISPTGAAPAGGDSRDMHFMGEALLGARAAYAVGEVPVGAVVAEPGGAILGRGQNRVEERGDCTAHAEMEALRGAMAARGSWRLLDTTLYCTLEPCPMCLSAAALARVARVVYAAPDRRLGAAGSWVNLVGHGHPYHEFAEVRGGICEQEAAQLLQDFFKERRKLGRWRPRGGVERINPPEHV